ncbi:LysR family transcriptional regulator [Kitasatospora sp. NPDC059571]|uniref:LysR family transcriptional regulator n=1 Tax=Kitasatospora sp. NPDC059571 TaxID=3346871 RepID=UPI0036BECD7A
MSERAGTTTAARAPGTDATAAGPVGAAAFGRLPDLESLRLLVLVAETGSLGSAAARLGIAQPSASKRLSALERRLGLVLLDRTRRGSRLTDAGAAVVDRAQRVLFELDRLVTGAQALRSRHDAELRVAASMTVAEYLLPAWLGRLRRLRPDLQVSLQVTNSEQVPELVRTGAAGIGFIEAPQAPSGLSARQVAGDRLLVVVAPGHPWTRRRRPLDAAELAATPLVLRERGSGTRDTLDRALRRAGAGGSRRLLELGSATAVRNAVIAGTGPAVMSELAVRTAVADGRLVEVETAGIDLRRSLRAVWPPGRTPTGPAADLLACAGPGG